ncbi:hypothetical protein NE237_008999 [Protea cynaroides]|uniref:Uncharacterized protein n=1 Tax=Protea cynaroides TaxID=273540 RepID=A0A9Q0KXR4_9MAGN|nr:hypothetical protein NE237_008999 [Protea cynaroides]
MYGTDQILRLGLNQVDEGIQQINWIEGTGLVDEMHVGNERWVLDQVRLQWRWNNRFCWGSTGVIRKSLECMESRLHKDYDGSTKISKQGGGLIWFRLMPGPGGIIGFTVKSELQQVGMRMTGVVFNAEEFGMVALQGKAKWSEVVVNGDVGWLGLSDVAETYLIR